MIQVGRQAPDYEMEGVLNGEFKNYKLSDNRGKWTVMFFYPLDFTFVCPTEIQAFSRRYNEFQDLNTKVVGISTDSVHSHKAWMKHGLGELTYPLLSDITKDVSRRYGVLLEDQGIALRGTFIIDPEGVLRHSSINDLPVGRSIEETLRTIKALQTGQLCQVEWTPGQETLGKA